MAIIISTQAQCQVLNGSFELSNAPVCNSSIANSTFNSVQLNITAFGIANQLLAAVALGSFCTAGAFMLYFRLVRTLGSIGVASQSYLRAGVSVLLGVMLLGEPFTWSLGVGLAAVVVGVAASNGQLSLAWGFWLRREDASRG